MPFVLLENAARQCISFTIALNFFDAQSLHIFLHGFSASQVVDLLLLLLLQVTYRDTELRLKKICFINLNPGHIDLSV